MTLLAKKFILTVHAVTTRFIQFVCMSSRACELRKLEKISHVQSDKEVMFQQGGYVLICVCLFISRIMKKLLDRFSQNS